MAIKDIGGFYGGGGSRKNQSRRSMVSDTDQPFIAPDAIENRYQRGVKRVKDALGGIGLQDELVAGPAAKPSLVEGGNIFSSLWGPYPDVSVPAPVPPPAPIVGKTIPKIVIDKGVPLPKQRAKIRQAISKTIQRARQVVSGPGGSRSDSGASRGGNYGSSYGAGGYQGGTYGGAGGAAIGQGVGQAFKNR